MAMCSVCEKYGENSCSIFKMSAGERRRRYKNEASYEYIRGDGLVPIVCKECELVEGAHGRVIVPKCTFRTDRSLI